MFERSNLDAQIERILQSSIFEKSEKLQALLTYLVEQTLNESPDRLKGATIAIDVFNRDPAAFDSATDSIVRVQVGRLRAGLDAYYDGPGRNDPIRIDIPKGGYAVQFAAFGDPEPREEHAASPPEAERASDAGDAEPAAPASPPRVVAPAGPAPERRSRSGLTPNLVMLVIAATGLLGALVALALFPDGHDRPDGDSTNASMSSTPPQDAAPVDVEAATQGVSLQVQTIADLSAEGERIGADYGFTHDLVAALSRIDELVILAGPTSVEDVDAASKPPKRPAYILEGGVRRREGGVRVTVGLVNALTGETIWSNAYDREGQAAMDMQSSVVSDITADIRPQIYGAARRDIVRRGVERDNAWELYFQSTFVPGDAVDTLEWEKQRVDMARRALAISPNFGEAHSVLAEKLSYLANVDPRWDTRANEEAAEEHARQAIEYARASSDAMFNLGLHYWHVGDVERATTMMERVVELDPNHVMSRFQLIVLPETCLPTSTGVLDRARAFEAQLSPDHPARWVILYDLARLEVNAGDFEAALALHRRIETLGTIPLVNLQYAAVLVKVGKWDEAVGLIEGYRAAWPNIDAGHMAEVVVPRRCQRKQNQTMLQELYRDLDKVLDASALH